MITSLRIERFKCFEDITITFGNLTLLAGANGTGKSTVIQALLLLRESLITSTQSLVIRNNAISLNTDIVKIGTAKEALFDDSHEDNISFTIIYDEDPVQQSKWTFNYEREYPLQFFMQEGLSDSQPTQLKGLFGPKFFYLMAERLGPRLTYPFSRLPSENMHVGFQGEFTAHCLAEFGDRPIPHPNLALKSDDGSINHTLSHQTQLWMRKIIPGFAFNVEPIIKADRVRLELKIYGEYRRPTNIGFGACYTLPIIVAGLMAGSDTLLIVENPEAHLHPAGQSYIARFLCQVAENGVQVIIETHSDHILNGLRISVKNNIISSKNASIQYFYRDNNLAKTNLKKPILYQDGGIDSWPEGFLDQFERDLQELF